MATKINTKKPKRTGHIKTSGVRRHRYGPTVLVIFLILIAAAVFVGYKVIKSFNEPVLKKPEDNISSSEDSKKDDVDTSSQPQKEDNAENKSELTREEGKPNLKYEGDDVNNAETLTGIINYVGLSDNTFMVRVAIDQTVSKGTCDYILTSPSGRIYSFSNETTSGPSSTYCGLNADFTGLGSETGTWKISATIKSSNGKFGTISGEGAV